MPSILSRAFRAPLSKLAKFSADHSGIAAVEFGLIVPVLLIMMLGAIELSRAVVMARRFNTATQMASDLIAREQQMDNAGLQGVANAVTTLWTPYDQTTLQMQVLQVRRASDQATKKTPGSIYVDWQYVMFPGAVPNKKNDNDPYVLSNPSMLSNGGSTLIVNATYTFTSLFGAAVAGMTPTMPWTSSSSHTPRLLCVDYRNDNCLPKWE
jgi:Flp pilus assembly protein TadG